MAQFSVNNLPRNLLGNAIPMQNKAEAHIDGRSVLDNIYGQSSNPSIQANPPSRYRSALMGNRGFMNGVSQPRNFSALNLSPLQKQNIINQSYTRNKLPIPTSSISNQKMIEMANARGQTSQGNVRQDGTPPNLKNNLLNYIASPHGKGMAQGLLEASGYSEVPVTFGQALSMGMKRGTEANASAAASQLAKDKFAYEQKQDTALNWLKLQEILSKDSRTSVEKQMSTFFPHLIPGSPEYAEQAMKILKSGGMNLDLGVQTAWGTLETGSSNILTGLSKEYRTNYDNANNTLSQLQTLKTTLMPLSEEKFGTLSPTKLAFAQFLSGMGFPIDIENQALMESVFAQGGALVMGQIALTKGAVSEKEMKYFDMISPSLTKTKSGMLLMISILEHGQKHKQNVFNEYTKFKKTWKKRQAEGASPFDLEAEWNEQLIKLENESTTPKNIMDQIDNIVYKQAFKDLPEGVTAILDPKKDIDFIEKQFKKEDGSDRFLSEQFIGFDAAGYPTYMVEDGKSNFRKLKVFPEGDNN